MYKHNYIPSFGLIFLAEGRLITCGERLKVYCDPLPGKSNCRNGRGANFIMRVASVHLAKTSFSPKSHSKRSYKITAVGRKWIYMYFESLPRDIIPPPPANFTTLTLTIVHSLPITCCVFPEPVLSWFAPCLYTEIKKLKTIGYRHFCYFCFVFNLVLCDLFAFPNKFQ